MPSKHVSEEQALIGVGAILLREMATGSHTVTGLWERLRAERAVGSFERFILALDMLYISGAITTSQGMLKRVGT